MNRGFTYYIRDKINKDLVYYGSSELPTVEDRMKLHLYSFNSWKKNKGKYCSSFKVLEKDNYEYDTIEVVWFDTKYELRQCERLLIERQVCVNKIIPNRTDKEYKIDNKEKIKQYRIDNKEKRNEYIKQYHIDNKEKLNERSKQYYIDNKEKILEQNNQKITCECGCVVSRRNIIRHCKSKKHISLIS